MPVQRSEGFMRRAMAAHDNSVYLVALAQTRSGPCPRSSA